MRDRLGRACCLLLASACAGVLAADSVLIDPSDGWLDGTRWLKGRYGFMPVPIIITEPAVGYGGGAALALLHEPIGGEDGKAPGPPSISAVAGAATENGTWFTGGGHFGSWADDHFRYLGGLGRAHVNIDYWVDDRAYAYSMDTWALAQRFQARLPDTPVFGGLRYTFMDNRLAGDAVDRLPDELARLRTGGLGGSLSWDTLDNLLTPTSGVQLDYVGMAYAPAFGGEQEYQRYEARQRVHLPLAGTLGLGVRIDGQFAQGDVPFWHQPYIDMRGVAAARYQDEAVLVGELELSWNVWRRFWLIGFGGAGAAEDSAGDLHDGDWHPAGGGGLRYLLARGFGLLGGIDIAASEGQTAVYITIGNAWGR